MNEQPTNPASITSVSSEGKPVIPPERVEAVIKREQDKAKLAENKATEVGSLIPPIQERVKEAQSSSLQAEAKLMDQAHKESEHIKDTMKQEKSFLGLGKFFGRQERQQLAEQDEAKMEELRRQLRSTRQEAEIAQNNLQKTESSQNELLRSAKHATEVKQANESGGPMEASSKMTESLKSQDVVKYYSEVNYPIENTDYLIPQPIIEQLTPKIQELILNRGTNDSSSPVHYSMIRVQGIEERITKNKKILKEGTADQEIKIRIEALQRNLWWENSQSSKNYETINKIREEIAKNEGILKTETATQEINEELSEDQKSLELEKTKLQLKINSEVKKAIVGITPFYEEIIKLTDQEQIPLSQHLFTQMIARGMQISSVGGGEFAEKVLGRGVNLGTALNSRGDSELEKFFSKYRNIQDRNRLPYVLAFGAGVLIDDRYYKGSSVHESLRNWLAETLPVQGRESVRENNQWVTKTTEPQEKGFGYVLKLSERMGYGKSLKDLIENTDDPGWYEAIKEANQIVSNIYKVMREKESSIVSKVEDRYTYPLQEMKEKFIGHSKLSVDPDNLFSEPILNQSRY